MGRVENSTLEITVSVDKHSDENTVLVITFLDRVPVENTSLVITVLCKFLVAAVHIVVVHLVENINLATTTSAIRLPVEKPVDS